MNGDAMFSLEGKKIWVAGHRGMVGSAIVRRLEKGPCEILTVGRDAVDLRQQQAVQDWMEVERPEVVFLAAAKVGGIKANDTYPAEFLYENLMIEANIIHAAWRTGVKKLVFLGSTCIYPKMAQQPMVEEALLTGPLEPTNEWYAIAKIAGIKLCQSYRRQYGCDFIAVQPTNLYGPGDNYDVNTGHVLAALMKKTHEAKLLGSPTLTVWGSGKPKREFLYVDDLAEAVVFLAERYSDESHINIGSGEEVSILELAKNIIDVVGYDGRIVFDDTKPDGTPRKLSDLGRIKSLGWSSTTPLLQGLAATYRQSFLSAG